MFQKKKCVAKISANLVGQNLDAGCCAHAVRQYVHVASKELFGF
jgi:hypothetical protein